MIVTAKKVVFSSTTETYDRTQFLEENQMVPCCESKHPSKGIQCELPLHHHGRHQSGVRVETWDDPPVQGESREEFERDRFGTAGRPISEPKESDGAKLFRRLREGGIVK
jgi:hypothetical protein